MINFGMRNLTLFFKDKTAVFLSFLAEIIIICLYILFIRDNLLESLKYIENAERIIDSWIISGLLAITSVTTTMGAFGVMVNDKENAVSKDFYVSPVKRLYFLGGYLYSAVIIGLLMSFFVLIVAELYIKLRFNASLFSDYFLIGCILVVYITICNSVFVLFCVSFIKSSMALAGCCTILGALMGFLTGIYIPIGNLPEAVQGLVKAFPVSQGVVLFRQTIMNDQVDKSFINKASVEKESFRQLMGINYTVHERILTPMDSVLIMGIFSVIFLILSVYIYNKKAYK